MGTFLAHWPLYNIQPDRGSLLIWLCLPETARAQWSAHMSLRVHPFSFLGCYPTPDVRFGGDALLRNGRTLFCCTQNRVIDRYRRTGPDQPGFERNNWTFHKIRLLASDGFPWELRPSGPKNQRAAANCSSGKYLNI